MSQVAWSKERKSNRYSTNSQQEKKINPDNYKSYRSHMPQGVRTCENTNFVQVMFEVWASPHHGTLSPSNPVICNSCKSLSRRVKGKFQPPACLDRSASEWPLIIYLAKSWVRTTQFILSVDQKSPSLGNTQDETEEMAQPVKCLLYRQKDLSSTPCIYVKTLAVHTCDPRLER